MDDPRELYWNFLALALAEPICEAMLERQGTEDYFSNTARTLDYGRNTHKTTVIREFIRLTRNTIAVVATKEAEESYRNLPVITIDDYRMSAHRNYPKSVLFIFDSCRPHRFYTKSVVLGSY